MGADIDTRTFFKTLTEKTLELKLKWVKTIVIFII